MMYKLIFYLLVPFLVLGCKPLQDQTLPPNVTPEEVSDVPLNPYFNKDIRPLLVKLANQADPLNQEKWQTWNMFGLPFSELQEALIEDKSLYGVDNAKDLTKLWRWAQAGGSISHKEWIVSPLKVVTNPFAPTYDPSTLHVKLAKYWLTNIAELEEQELDSPFGKWLAESMRSRVGYDKILDEVFNTKQNSAVSRLLADEPAMINKRLANILGANESQQVLNESIDTDLFEEFGVWERKPLIGQALRIKVNDKLLALDKNITQILNIQNINGKSPLFDQNNFQSYGTRWFQQKPAYLPLLEPSLYKSFDSGKATGVFLRGQFLSDSPVKVNLSATKPFSALSFWVTKDYHAVLDFGYTNISISQNHHTVDISFLKDGKTFFNYKTPVESISDNWNHILLSFNPEKKNGFDFRMNGKEMAPPNDFNVNLRKKVYSFSISGTGALDELKVYQTSKPLTDLDNLCSYDPTIAQREFFSPSRLIYKHFFMLGNSDYDDLVKQNIILRESVEKLILKGEAEKVLPENMQFHLKKGEYFGNLIPLEIREKNSNELSSWLTKDAASWVARATVNWVHDAIHGTPIFDPTFPDSEIPDSWETVDQLADHLIKSSWDLVELGIQVSKAPLN